MLTVTNNRVKPKHSITVNVPNYLLEQVKTHVNEDEFPSCSEFIRFVSEAYLQQLEHYDRKMILTSVSLDPEMRDRIDALKLFGSVSDFIRTALREIDLSTVKYESRKFIRLPWSVHNGVLRYRIIKRSKLLNPSKKWSKLALNFIHERFGIVVAENGYNKASWSDL